MKSMNSPGFLLQPTFVAIPFFDTEKKLVT